jgi:uncharacterized damage-inducible protein DinB
MDTQNEMLVNLVLTAWRGQNKKLDEMITKYSDDQWLQETAPGRNTGIYLLGHLTAVNDGLITILGFGNGLYPALENVFLFNADKSGQTMPSVAELKSCWRTININLEAYIAKMKPEEWLSRHTKVSEEDFAKEPHRNKLNVLISRTVHQSYHLGQLAYLG